MSLKVVFPIPPPTTNDLSSHQRTLLLRKAKKLEQIFGATPRLVDDVDVEPCDPVHIELARWPAQLKKLRGSIESSSARSSCDSLPPRKPPSWRSAKVPVLGLFRKSTTLEPIPASPSPSKASHPNSSPRSSMDSKSDVVFTQITVVPDEDSSLPNSSTSDSYNITSLSSLRKQKMDRLRRKLGEDVPLDLVFPSSSDTESERSITPNLPTAPSTLHRRRSTACDSVQLANRQSITEKTIITTTPIVSSPNRLSTRLSLIIESPDEHGVGCAQEFGLAPKPDQGAKFKSEWTVNKGGTEVQLWSTRKGYEGWLPTNASQTPPTMSSSRPPPPNVPLNTTTELKKKPSSYRKPVPSFLE